MFHDLRYAARSLTRNPGFTVVVVLILALGIGANTAIFSLVNAVLIQPLGFAEPERLVALYEGTTGAAFSRFPFSAPDLRDLERSQQSYQGVGAYRNVPFELSGDGDPERITGAKITASLFPLLGVEPVLGRFISAAEDRPGGDVAILS